MSKETPQFKPGISEKIKQEQLAILDAGRERIEKGEALGKIEYDAEFFLITIPLKTGEEVTEYLPRNFDPVSLGKNKGDVSISDAIEAVQRFYPEMEKPNFREAVERLKKIREKSKI